jgi:AcrR family transcriptional regulator
MSEILSISRKEQILQVAARLFRERGYASTSMRDIATELGIEAASLYHHIKSKEEILETICFSIAGQLMNAIREVNDIYFNAEEKLRMAITNHVRIITQHVDRSGVFLHEWRSLSQPKLEEFRLLRDEYENEVKVILEEGVNEDIFDNVDRKFATLTILSTLNWINEWYRPQGAMTAEEIAQKLSDFIMGGLRKKLVTDINYRP